MSSDPQPPPNSLHWPGDPRWRDEPAFSSEVADLLTTAYACLARAHVRADAYVLAHRHSSACLPKVMSLRQRVQTYYALGSAYIGGEMEEQGVPCLVTAIGHAEELGDLGACAEIAFLAGSVERARSHYPIAVEYQSYSLANLSALNSDGAAWDIDLEVDVLLALATAHFLLAHIETAQEFIDEIERRSMLIRPDDTRSGALEWLRANLFRWNGQPERALRHAMVAAGLYDGFDSLSAERAHGRLNAIIAEIALDLAEVLPTSGYLHGQDALLTFAAPYIERGVTIARKLDDKAGEDVAILVRLRHQRFTAADTDRIVTIERIARQAEQRGDPPTICHAKTALGYELLMAGDTDAALVVFRQAVDLSHLYEMPANGTWAYRALLRAQEMRP
jgi:hypothetical protein